MDITLNELKVQFGLAHTDFIQVANQLDPKQHNQPGVCGEWSPKDVVAHLVGWDKSLKVFIVDIANFDPPYDVDSFNNLSVKSRKQMSWDEVIEELESNFLDLEQAIVTIEPYMQIYNRVKSWLAGRIEDYMLHRSQIEDWLS